MQGFHFFVLTRPCLVPPLFRSPRSHRPLPVDVHDYEQLAKLKQLDDEEAEATYGNDAVFQRGGVGFTNSGVSRANPLFLKGVSQSDLVSSQTKRCAGHCGALSLL